MIIIPIVCQDPSCWFWNAALQDDPSAGASTAKRSDKLHGNRDLTYPSWIMDMACGEACVSVTDCISYRPVADAGGRPMRGAIKGLGVDMKDAMK